MIEIEHPRNIDGIITIRASGTLTANDYDAAIPELEHALKLADGPLRLLVSLEDFRGWEIEALWKDLKFDVRHLSDAGRIAVVGETTWEEWATKLSAPFAKADIRFFPRENEDEAEIWLREGLPTG